MTQPKYGPRQVLAAVPQVCGASAGTSFKNIRTPVRGAPPKADKEWLQFLGRNGFEANLLKRNTAHGRFSPLFQKCVVQVEAKHRADSPGADSLQAAWAICSKVLLHLFFITLEPPFK